MQTFTLRLNDAFKKKIEQRAKAEHKSMNQGVNDLINVGILIDELTDESSKVVIRHAKGFEPDQEAIAVVRKLRTLLIHESHWLWTSVADLS